MNIELCTAKTVKIEAAVSNDTQSILAINNHCLTAPFTDRWYQEHVAMEEDKVRVARHEGQVVGFIIYKIRPEGGYISYIAVQPAYRGLGIGTLLIEDGAAALLNLGKEFFRLHVCAKDQAARRFYAKCRFDEILRLNNFYGKDEPGILLKGGLQEIINRA